jgi:outer membrane protein assembly factor BamE (lipoprotein component of BamABCDE complex)
MDLREAYVELELAVGASEEAVRDARKTLAKVWHPDRHANDPELQKKAEQKLADVNNAFELIRAAGFPSSIPAAKAEAKKPAPEPKKPAPEPPKPAPAPVVSQTEFVPQRRVRWSVLLLLVVAIGIGTYFAIVKLGGKSTPAKPVAERPTADAAVVADPWSGPEAAVVEPSEPDAEVVVAGPDAAEAPKTGTFTLGSTHEQVTAAQGKPTKTDNVIDEHWFYGFSIVTFNKRGKVSGWWDRDDVLNVKLEPSDPAVAAKAKTAGSFGMGASKDEVIGVQGTPKRVDTVIDETWYYGRASSVVFNGTGKVTGYHNSNGELNLQ